MEEEAAEESDCVEEEMEVSVHLPLSTLCCDKAIVLEGGGGGVARRPLDMQLKYSLIL